MSERYNHSRKLDDQLAEFTNQVMAGVSVEVTAAGHSPQDREVQELEKVVMRVNKAFRADELDGELAGRIHARLAAEWKKRATTARGAGMRRTDWHRFLTERIRWRPFAGQPRRALAFVFVAALAALFLMITPLISPQRPRVRGAIATEMDFSTTLLIGIIVAGIVFGVALLLWIVRKRR